MVATIQRQADRVAKMKVAKGDTRGSFYITPNVVRWALENGYLRHIEAVNELRSAYRARNSVDEYSKLSAVELSKLAAKYEERLERIRRQAAFER